MKPQTTVDIVQDVGSAADNAQIAGVLAPGMQVNGDFIVHVHGTPGKYERVQIPALSGALCLGRTDKIAEVMAAFDSRRSALLYGMPGIGKSVLAAAAIGALHERKALENGLLWISEIGSAPIESVCDAIARQTGNDQILRSPAQQKPDLTRMLLAKYENVPVVADQVESYETAQAIADICQQAGVGLLVTSRTRHPIAEVDIPVTPLSLECATELFRSQAHSQEQSDALARDICTLLECHPLAIVIAAKRVRAQAMPLERLKARLENEKTRLQSLAIDESGDKSSSIWACLNLSYTALSETQRMVLTRLAACFGRTTGIELLAKVCGLSELDCEDYVGRLVAQSLVERRGEQVGLQLLIRDFGRDVLGGELPAVQDEVVNAVNWYVAQNREERPEHFDKLESELGNLLGAIRHAEDRQMWETQLDLVEILGGEMTKMLGVRGYWTEILAVRETGIRAAEKLDRPREAARLRHNAARVRQMRGDLTEAAQLYQQNVKDFQTLGYQEGVAVSLHNLGALALDQGNIEEARGFYEQSLKLKEELGARQTSATTLHELGRLAYLQCDFDRALEFYQRSLEIQSEFNEQDGVASNRQQIGLIKQLRGEIKEAQDLFQSNLDAYRQLGSRVGIANSQLCLGSLACEKGQFDDARELLEQSLAGSESLGYRSLVAEITFELGVLCQEQDQLDEALRHYETSRGIHQTLKDKLSAAYCQHKLGTIALSRDQLDVAEELLKDGFAIFEMLSDDVGIAASLRELGRVEVARRQLDEAEAHLVQARDIEEKLGHQLGLAHTWRALGQLASARCNTVDAQNLFAKSLAIFERLQSPYAEKVRQDLASL